MLTFNAYWQPMPHISLTLVKSLCVCRERDIYRKICPEPILELLHIFIPVLRQVG